MIVQHDSLLTFANYHWTQSTAEADGIWQSTGHTEILNLTPPDARPNPHGLQMTSSGDIFPGEAGQPGLQYIICRMSNQMTIHKHEHPKLEPLRLVKLSFKENNANIMAIQLIVDIFQSS